MLWAGLGDWTGLTASRIDEAGRSETVELWKARLDGGRAEGLPG